MGTALYLLVAYVLLLLGMLINSGAYHPAALVLLLASFGFLAAAFASAIRGGARDRRVPGVPVFALAVIVLLVAATTQPVGFYLETPLYETLHNAWVAVLALGILGAYVLYRGESHTVRRAVFVAAVLTAVFFRVWMPVASPNPIIDVFTVGQEGARNLLAGINPYTVPVSDVYAGAGLDIQGYTYLPANLYVQSIAHWLTQDVRYAHIVAELVAAFALWRLSRRRWSDSTAELMTLLFLYGTRSLFVIEQSWVDPLILMFFALFLLLRDEHRDMLAAVAYGYMIFLKQYLVFALFQWFIVERRWKRILAGVAVGLLTLLPFALADLRALLFNGVFFNVLIPFREDSLTVFSFLSQTWGLQPPFGLTVVVGAVIAIATAIPQRRIRPIRGYLFAITLTTFGMFLFGTSGFCNWYYLVAGQLIFLLALGGKPLKTEELEAFDQVGFAAE